MILKLKKNSSEVALSHIGLIIIGYYTFAHGDSRITAENTNITSVNLHINLQNNQPLQT